ncbi:MAG: tRNA guanosine(34) transglycosylase Tgt, partial [Candidatus Krumholzibacteriota bacterium]|nr:tRNA guanosine(34) transglycosylase Tgt [Candidatus Krumholzibacteriota bacterium]
VTFRSHVDGSLHLFTPETVMEAQARIGADIIMSFDYCATLPGDRDEVERAVELSTQWARRGRDVVGTRFDRKGYEQVVFGIVQGGSFEDLRRRSMDALLELDFPGYAVGGLSVGEEKDVMWKMTGLVTSGLPMDRPRYLMGVGTPLDLIEGVSYGVDMFDCVLPTRNARNGTIFTRDGRMVLRNATYTRDMRAIDEECACMTCRNFTRSYLRHLFATGEILGPVLATHHSLFFYCDTMREMRSAIQRGDFESWRSDFVERYTANDKK